MSEKRKELSFFDLFTVLVKYRKLILIPTFVFALVYSIILFVIPVIFPNTNKSAVKMMVSVKVEPVSSTLEKYLNIDVPTLAEKNLKDVINFSKVERDYHLWTDKELSDRMYNTAVMQVLDNKVFNVEKDTKSLFRVTTVIAENDTETFKRFLEDYLLYCSNVIDEQFEISLSSAENNISQMVERYTQKNDTVNADISNFLTLQTEFQNFRKSHKQFLTVSGEPFEVNLSKGRVKKIVFSVFSVFILLILLSFLLNLISEIKADPEKSQKLKDAWKAGK